MDRLSPRLEWARHAPRPFAAGVLVAGVLVAVLLLVRGCGEHRHPHPTALADGSTAQPTPPELQSLGSGAFLTRVRATTAAGLDRRARACVDSAAGRPVDPRQAIIERVDALGSSSTFQPRPGRFVFGCTSGSGTPSSRSWCGHVAGELRGGELVDPRLDIACRTQAGAPIGSVWITPVAGARWIVVRDRPGIQIYRVAGSLPVRVTTTSVDLATATAVFRVEQYDDSGARVAEATLRTAVAG